MITTTTAPPWPRRSDQAVTWARGMLSPGHAVVIDCETTDLPGAICEVAVVDTKGRILLNTLINPCQPISPDATRVHNITDRMVAGAPGFPDALTDVLRVTAGRRVLAYNAPFDYECLRSDAQRYDRNPEHLDDPDGQTGHQRRAQRPGRGDRRNPARSVSWQRCRTHYAVNLMAITPKASWPWVKTMLHSVYDQIDAKAVAAQFDRVITALGEKLPAVADHLDEAREELLASPGSRRRSGGRSGPTTPRND